MRSIRSPYLTDQQPKTEQPDDSGEQAQPAAEADEQVAPVVPLRNGQPQTPAKPSAPRLDRFVEFVQGPLSDWISREHPSYMPSPITFVRERWSPSWLPDDAGLMLWAWRVLLLARALLYTAFYIPAMTIFLPELTTAAIVAYLILRFFT
ncbi:hypothetical protein ABZ470_26175 [Streptosporangium sp. NPDC020072]|uniref:hypothetical protein n=1 Tax=Streptosporangium sp. NPDC020072 TaxID=3154788 RepID=UPI003426CF63